MSELLNLYAFSTLLTILIGFPVAASGAHLSAKNQTLELFVLTQIAILIFYLLELLSLAFPLKKEPLFLMQFALSFGSMAFFKISTKKNNLSFLSLYLLLIVTSQALLSSFPILKANHQLSLFGDMATLNGNVPLISALISFILFIIYCLKSKAFIKETFEWCVQGEMKLFSLFDFISLAAITLSLFNLGPYHTLALACLPSFILRISPSGHRTFLFAALMSSFLSPIMAITSSLYIPRIPTLALFIYFLIAILLLWRGYFSYSAQKRRKRACGSP